MAFSLGKMAFVSAVLIGLFALIKYAVYGISEDFGWGFLAGALLTGIICVLGMHVEMQDQLAKQREDLTREL